MNPGKPLAPISTYYAPIVGSGGQRYVNILTGATVTRYTYEKSIAQAYGFRNLNEYRQFSKAVGGLGGLRGLNVRDVKRARKIIAEHPNNRLVGIFTQRWLTAPTKQARLESLNRLLDAAGIRTYTRHYFPGETPKMRGR